MAMVRPFVAAIIRDYKLVRVRNYEILPITPPPPMVAAEITRGRVARDKGLPVSARPGPRCKEKESTPHSCCVVVAGSPQCSRRGDGTLPNRSPVGGWSHQAEDPPMLC
jgi:hypothetical protein